MKTLILIILTLLNIGTPADTNEGEFHLYQINFADSLYKNYQPQHNFVEVKAAMEYFDSIQMSVTIHQHQGNEYQRLCDSLSFICAKAHYYYAIGLSEKDDITGACEHHLHALEVMEELMMKNKMRKGKVYETADAGSSDTINPQEYVYLEPSMNSSNINVNLASSNYPSNIYKLQTHTLTHYGNF